MHFAAILRTEEIHTSEKAKVRKHLLALHHLNALSYAVRYKTTHPGEKPAPWAFSSLRDAYDKVRSLNDKAMWNALQSVDYNVLKHYATLPEHRAALRWLKDRIAYYANRIVMHTVPLHDHESAAWSIEPGDEHKVWP
jgi:hypothetical protein